MIEKETTYSIRCDVCMDQFYSEEWDDTRFLDAKYAERAAVLEGWTIEDGKHICPDCYLEKYGEED